VGKVWSHRRFSPVFPWIQSNPNFKLLANGKGVSLILIKTRKNHPCVLNKI
jgi:hypothetical protein